MFEKFFKYRTPILFFGVFVLVCALQLGIWMTFPVADQHIWATDASKVAGGQHLTPADTSYAHPGATVLFPMAGLIYAGVDADSAVQIVMALFIALFATLAAFVAYLLRPTQWWWIAMLAILALDLRLVHATPPSSAATVVSVLFFLLLWYIVEKVTTEYWPLIYLGVCAGVLLATRIDTGVFLYMTALPLLFYKLRFQIWIPTVIAAAVFFICNPHMWFAPVSYVLSIPALYLYNESLAGQPMFFPFLVTFPFALVSIASSLIVMFNSSYSKPVPRSAYLWLLVSTIVLTALLAPLQFHPRRYYMPLYVAWDCLLPLWIYELARNMPIKMPKFIMQRFGWIALAGIAFITIVRWGLFLTGDTLEIIL